MRQAIRAQAQRPAGTYTLFDTATEYRVTGPDASKAAHAQMEAAGAAMLEQRHSYGADQLSAFMASRGLHVNGRRRL